MTKSENKKKIYSPFLNRERYLRKRNPGRFPRNEKTTLAGDLSLLEIKEYFDSNALPDQQRKEFRSVVRLADHWLEITGALLYPSLRPAKILGDTLIVHTSHPAMSAQAHLFEEQMIERIHRYAGLTYIMKIRFQACKPDGKDSFSHLKQRKAQEEQLSFDDKIEKFKEFLKTK